MKFNFFCVGACFIILASCTHKNLISENSNYSCENQSASSGEDVDFYVKVIAFKKDALHLDFDTFGADFSVVEMLVEAPNAWRGTVLGAYYQDLPLVSGRELMLETSFNFKAVPPPCLDQPWLFLSNIEAEYANE